MMCAKEVADTIVNMGRSPIADEVRRGRCWKHRSLPSQPFHRRVLKLMDSDEPLPAMGRHYDSWPLPGVMSWCVEIIRGLPAIFQRVTIDFGLNPLGLILSPLTSGLMDVAQDPREAATAVGLSSGVTLRNRRDGLVRHALRDGRLGIARMERRAAPDRLAKPCTSQGLGVPGLWLAVTHSSNIRDRSRRRLH